MVSVALKVTHAAQLEGEAEAAHSSVVHLVKLTIKEKRR